MNTAAWRDAVGALFVIGIATLLVYSNTFHAPFQFDDLPNIVDNDALRDLGSFWPPSGSRWLGHLTFALNFRLGGLSVVGYHAVNVVIHLCSALLVASLTAITLRTPALRDASAGPLVRRYSPLAAGLLFAVHPVQTQAVTYVVQRFASLATLLYLLAVTSYALARRSLERERSSRIRTACLFALSVLAAAGAMKTKEISFTLPVVVAGYELLFFRGGRRRLFLLSLGAALLVVAFGLGLHGATPLQALDDATRAAAEGREIPRSVYLLTETRVVVTYLRLLVLPVQQNVDYDFALSRSVDADVLFALAILATIAAAAVLLLLRARRTNDARGVLVFSGVAWFFVTLAVESSVVPIPDVIVEHRLYLPSAGAAVALATALLWSMERLRWTGRSGVPCAAALLLTAGPLAAATYARNAVWKDGVSLWSDAVAKSPGKARAHNNLAFAYQSEGRLEDALREYREAIRLEPSWGFPRGNVAAIYQRRGRVEDALAEYREALRLEPRWAGAHVSIARIHRQEGRFDDAAREYRQALELAPGWARARAELAVVYHEQGRLDEAVHENEEALRLAPGLAEAHRNLGALHFVGGRLDAAAVEFTQAIRHDPELADAHNGLGVVRSRQGRTAEAVRELQEAIRIDPGLVDAKENLEAVLQMSRGRPFPAAPSQPSEGGSLSR